MFLDVVLAIAAALVAILGIAYDPKEAQISMTAVERICDLHRWSIGLAVPRMLVLLALSIGGFAIWKSSRDYGEQEFVRSALTQTLGATPKVIKQIYDQMGHVAEGYTLLDYFTAPDGMVIFMRRTGKNQAEGSGHTEAVILDTSQLADIRASLILKKNPSPLLREALNEDFNLGPDRDELYARLCALFSVAGRQVLLKSAVDCYYGDKKGIILTVNVNDVEQQVCLPVREIEQYGGQQPTTAFGALSSVLQAKVEAATHLPLGGVPHCDTTP